MDSTNKVWLPDGLNEGFQQPLSVPAPHGPMTYSLYVSLLESKLQRLIDANPKQARAAMQMSSESAPGLWAIQEQYDPSQWAAQIVRSDQASNLFSRIDWQGSLSDPEPENLQEMLELLA